MKAQIQTQDQLCAASEAAHTPIPWKLSHELPDGFSVAHQPFPGNPRLILAALGFTRANAEFIVLACNSHAALVAENAKLRAALGGQ